MNALWALALSALTMLLPIASPARSIDKGAMSGVSTARQVVVSDREGWMALWRAHAPDRPLPEVDFSREIVVGVFLGSRPNGGFAIEIVGYREDGGRVVVEYRETTPARGAITAQVLVSPYHLVALPKPAGTVTFEKLTP